LQRYEEILKRAKLSHKNIKNTWSCQIFFVS